MSSADIEMEFGVPIPGRILPQEQWAKTAIKRLPETGPLDWETIFGRRAPVVLDLGCGNGRFTLGSALARPELNHFAIDALPVVIRYATRRGNQRGLANVRFAVKDAETFVARYVGDSSIAEAHLYHPQPYHQSRRAGRRVYTPKFLADVHRALEPGGLFVVQTDNPDYWKYMARVTPCFFTFEEHPAPWPDSPQGRTRREIVARQQGLKIYRGVGRRRDDITPSEALELANSLPGPIFKTHGPWRDLDRLESKGS